MHTKPYIIEHNQKGFTLVEITVVLVLMAIIAAYVIGRSVATNQVEVASQTDRIRNQIRYTQSIAMKRSDAVWGITCDTNHYWMFRGSPATPEVLPGERDAQINLADLGISLSAFTLYFDRIGKPYIAYTDVDDNNPLNNNLDITVSASGQSRNITVIPETGLAQ